jgi:hypothetical protein
MPIRIAMARPQLLEPPVATPSSRRTVTTPKKAHTTQRNTLKKVLTAGATLTDVRQDGARRSVARLPHCKRRWR